MCMQCFAISNMNMSKRERERAKRGREKKKVKKRNYLIELNTWKKGAFVYNSQPKHYSELYKSMVNLLLSEWSEDADAALLAAWNVCEENSHGSGERR